MDKARFSDLALGHLDGRLSDIEFEELQEALESDSNFRLEYANLARLDCELNDYSEVEKVVSFPSFSYRSKIISAAAAICALLIPVWFLLESDESEVAENQIVGGSIAVVSAEAGAVWEEPIGLGFALEPGLYKLNEGLAQIDFFGGASVSVSAPAEIELVSSDSAILHRGTLKADVPPAARGFEIRTGDVLLEDLGTSFGLSVGIDDKADLVVFDGEVRATGIDGKPVQLLEGDSVRLNRGQATRQSAKNVESEFPDITDIIAGSGTREDTRYGSWKEGSLDRRRDPRLIAYYDFEDLTAVSRRLRNQALHGTGSELDGGIVGARAAQGRWKHKTALDFRSVGDRVRFDIPGEFEKISLYAWVRIDALDRRMNALFLTDYFDENEIHWQISNLGALHFAVSPKGVVDLKKHNRRFYSDVFWEPEKSGQWFLLATTAVSGKGSEVIHYINGRPVGFSGGTNREKPLPKLRIGEADLGNWTDPIWPKVSIRTLNGRIDEFALFSEVLSPGEIAEIYEQGRP